MSPVGHGEVTESGWRGRRCVGASEQREEDGKSTATQKWPSMNY